METESAAVFVLAEQMEGAIQPVSLQIVGKARRLADQLRTKVGVILFGQDLMNDVHKLIAAGADLVLQADSESLVPYQSELYTEIIVKLMVEYCPEILLIGSTFMGREIAPLIAAKLKTGLTAHCIELVIGREGILEQRIPAYGGMITIVCPERRPQMATVANGVFPNPVLNPVRSGEVISIEVPKNLPKRVQTLEIIREKLEGVSLETASVIVAGGAGAGDQEGWKQIEELAGILNAGFGSTRPAVDAGWTELETMIGQSGRMVNPDVYIGVGLSGELQHMVGVVGAKIMIAINKDAKASIFEKVDYGVVEDCRVFVPALVKRLKEKESATGKVTHVD
jgi:electron transfer flavoprotein alpha subunit